MEGAATPDGWRARREEGAVNRREEAACGQLFHRINMRSQRSIVIVSSFLVLGCSAEVAEEEC